MIERYALISGRIRQELQNLGQVVSRIEQAIEAAQRHPEDRLLYMDSVALNLHDFYAGLERTFHYIASHIEQSVPVGEGWHRELLRQMSVDVPGVRPPVLSTASIKAMDEYLRFRHVVRNVYTFDFDTERIERLAAQVQPAFEQVRSELLDLAEFVEHLAADE